jgi:hypothetical protein
MAMALIAPFAPKIARATPTAIIIAMPPAPMMVLVPTIWIARILLALLRISSILLIVAAI